MAANTSFSWPPRTYQVVISPTASRQLQERLPEAVAWARYEFIRGAYHR